MPEIVFHCSHERPDAEIAYQYHLSGDSARGMEYGACRHNVNPDGIEARDERVLTVARWLAQHLTSTLRDTRGAEALRLIGMDRRSAKEKRIFGENAVDILWDFDMLRYNQTPEQYLRQEAQGIIDLHAREGIVRAELNGAVLEFGAFDRETVRARASRINGQKGGRPQNDPDRKLTRVTLSVYADQHARLTGVNLSELVRDLLDAHMTTLPEQSDWDQLPSM